MGVKGNPRSPRSLLHAHWTGREPEFSPHQASPDGSTELEKIQDGCLRGRTVVKLTLCRGNLIERSSAPNQVLNITNNLTWFSAPRLQTLEEIRTQM